MGMQPWHTHNWASDGLRICAGAGDTCRFEDVVVDRPVCRKCEDEPQDLDNPHPSNCRRCGGPTSRREQKERAQARFKRIVECVNGSAGIPDPKGVPAMLDLVWGMAHDEAHEGHEAAKQVLYEMGFFRDEEEVAEELMA
jgi:hypothetical protein